MDRGSFSVECIFTLFGFKLLYPEHFFMARGNHESHGIQNDHDDRSGRGVRVDHGRYGNRGPQRRPLGNDGACFDEHGDNGNFGDLGRMW